MALLFEIPQPGLISCFRTWLKKGRKIHSQYRSHGTLTTNRDVSLGEMLRFVIPYASRGPSDVSRRSCEKHKNWDALDFTIAHFV